MTGTLPYFISTHRRGNWGGWCWAIRNHQRPTLFQELTYLAAGDAAEKAMPWPLLTVEYSERKPKPTPGTDDYIASPCGIVDGFDDATVAGESPNMTSDRTKIRELLTLAVGEGKIVDREDLFNFWYTRARTRAERMLLANLSLLRALAIELAIHECLSSSGVARVCLTHRRDRGLAAGRRESGVGVGLGWWCRIRSVAAAGGAGGD